MELSAYGACDPAKVEEKKRGVFLAHEATTRWTGMVSFGICTLFVRPSNQAADNYSSALSYCTRQNGIDPADIRKMLEIPEDYEDIC